MPSHLLSLWTSLQAPVGGGTAMTISSSSGRRPPSLLGGLCEVRAALNSSCRGENRLNSDVRCGHKRVVDLGSTPCYYLIISAPHLFPGLHGRVNGNHSSCLLSAYWVPGVRLRSSRGLTDLSLASTLRSDSCYHFHFTDEETGARMVKSLAQGQTA